MTLIDRYLLGRYCYVFTIAYTALFGLYFVIDVFTNVGDFLDMPGGMGTVVVELLRYYSYRAVAFFGAIGGSLEVIAAMTALALMQKNGEHYPIIAAGIPTYRMVRPLLVGAVLVNGLLVLNQELVIPRIALQLQQNAGSTGDTSAEIEPAIDFLADISIAGRRLNLKRRSIEGAEFVLRETKVATSLTPIVAAEAISVERTADQPAGWLLRGTSVKVSELPLTKLGRQLIVAGSEPGTLFVRTDVTFDQLHNRDSSVDYLATSELVQRVQNPSFSRRSVHSLSLALHNRLTKPILNLVVLMVGVPFIVRKESTSLLRNVAACSIVLGVMFAGNEVCSYLAKVHLLSPEQSVWLPIVGWGTFAAWTAALVKT